jgi:hypothetical protein
MAHFFVGQRVRVKRNENYPACPVPVGAEGRIVGEDWESHYKDDAWSIKTDAGDCVITKYDAGDYLEPILPDGHQACDDDFKRDLDRLLERQGIAA